MQASHWNLRMLSMVFFLMLFIRNAWSVRLQILHTNDTHAYLDQTAHDALRGGAARLKTLMDHHTALAFKEGIPTLRMDAGDFSEGNLYYMAKEARGVFDLHGNAMGYDVAILGNHDYLMGTSELNKIFEELNFKTQFITANIKVPFQYAALKSKLQPYKEFQIQGTRLAVLGLTTNELYFKWRMYNGTITSPINEAKSYAPYLKNRGNHFVIALTHIGVLRDIELAATTEDIDLVIGGHSHSKILKPIYIKNLISRKIPIVQTGQHMEYLGKLVVDLENGKPLKVVSYELIPVKNVEKNFEIQRMVASLDEDLFSLYGKEWLNTVVGFSDLKITDKKAPKKWAGYITDVMRDVTNSDVAIHTYGMSGDDFPIGKITRRDLYNGMPRAFEVDEKFGWNIYTTKVKGFWIRVLFEVLLKFGEPLNFSGVKLEMVKTHFGLRVKNVLINGEKISPFKDYSVAFSEGIVRGAIGIGNFTLSILRRPVKTPHKIWESLENSLKKDLETSGKTLDQMNIEDNRTYFDPREYLQVKSEK